MHLVFGESESAGSVVVAPAKEGPWTLGLAWQGVAGVALQSGPKESRVATLLSFAEMVFV